MKNLKDTIHLNGQVPGEIHMDLLRNGNIQDPYFKYNDIEYRWIAFEDWIYSRTFDVTPEFFSHQQVEFLFLFFIFYFVRPKIIIDVDIILNLTDNHCLLWN